jgi:molybdopterin-containing oxidoreductase family membrane subunit
MKESIMPADTTSIMGIFSSEHAAATAIDELRETPWTIERVHSPIPSHAIEHALELPRSRVGWFTLAGGIIGFFTGFLFAAFTATRWSLMVSGKPVVALVPFFIVGFEFTILFAVFGNVLGLISQARLPRFDTRPGYDERFSGDRFGVLACCNADEQDDLTRFFEENGAEIKTVNQ